MRLSPKIYSSIKSRILELTPNADIFLFGSRVDDSAKGGDIDLLLRVLSSLEKMNMVKTFTIIEKQVYKKVTHFGGQISKDSEVFLRRYTSPFRSGFERGQPQDYAANLQFAS
jgi:predicted nucleotidyltransferase